MDNPEEMDTFLEEYSPLKLSQEEIVDLNRPVTRSEIEFLIKKKKETACKQKSRTKWLHWGILPQTQRRIHTNPSQTLPKDWREGDTPKVILWSQRHPDIKPGKDTTKKKKKERNLQANISE